MHQELHSKEEDASCSSACHFKTFQTLFLPPVSEIPNPILPSFMDPHPALLPVARRRVASTSTLRPAAVRPKTVKKEKLMQPPAAVEAPARTRPKRAFGVTRNTNIPVEKPQLKQQKPAGPIANPARGNRATKENARVNPIQRKKQLQQVQLKDDKERKMEEAMRTPLPAAKKVVEDGTPYFSALNCSKCCLDQLETSTYWLNQIRLSEAVGKHFVSAAFFHLALECHAQPLEKIRSELKNYRKRHQTTSAMSLFDDLLQSYGLNLEKPKSECTDTLFLKSKKEALFSDTLKDEHKEKIDGIICKTENFTLKVEHEDCNSDGVSCSDISQEQVKSEQKQDKIDKNEDSEVAFSEIMKEADDEQKQHVFKDCSLSASDEITMRRSDEESPPTEGSLSNKISTTCLENKSSANKSGSIASELDESTYEQSVKDDNTKRISGAHVEIPAKDEVHS